MNGEELNDLTQNLEGAPDLDGGAALEALPALPAWLPEGVREVLVTLYGPDPLVTVAVVALVVALVTLAIVEVIKAIAERVGLRLRALVGPEGSPADLGSWDWGVRGASLVVGAVVGLLVAVFSNTFQLDPLGGLLLGVLAGGLDVPVWHVLRGLGRKALGLVRARLGLGG